MKRIDVEGQLLLPLVVGYGELYGIDDRHGALGVFVEVVADETVELGGTYYGVRLGDAHTLDEFFERLGGYAPVFKSRKGGHAGVVPAAHHALVDELL